MNRYDFIIFEYRVVSFPVSVCPFRTLLHHVCTSSVFSVRPTGISGQGIGFKDNECGVQLAWYFLFIIFVTYTMLPLPLRTCMILGCSTATIHVLYTAIMTSASKVSVRACCGRPLCPPVS
jgi:hypothetical protein